MRMRPGHTGTVRIAPLFIVVWLVSSTACAPGQASPAASSVGPVAASTPGAPVPSGDAYVVDRVIDGDTIVVRTPEGDVHVRLIGVDSPESVKPDTPVQCFAIAASNYTKHALTDTLVRLEYDVERYDRYGRTLAYVWVGTSMFNEELVRDGYAVVETVPPDVKYADLFVAAERDARRHDRGLWSACQTP
jgi:micrococcal nuclease